MWPFSASSEWIVEHITKLFVAEEQGRRYRARGDRAYEEKRHRACTEYHLMAGGYERDAATFRTALKRHLGPAGALDELDPADIAAARAEVAQLPSPWAAADDEFAAACFFARYPLWCEQVPRFRTALERWQADPRFRATAPGYRPLNPDWD